MRQARWIAAALLTAGLSPALAWAADAPDRAAHRYPVPTATAAPSTTAAAPTTPTVAPPTETTSVTDSTPTDTAPITTTASTTTTTPAAPPKPKPAFRRIHGSPFNAGSGTTDVAFSPNGRFLASADYQLNAVSMFRVDGNGRLVKIPGSPFPAGAGPISLSFSPDGRTLAVADYAAGSLTIEAVAQSGRLSPRAGSPIAVAGPPYAVSYSPDGRALAVADWTGDTIQVFTNHAASGVPGAPVVSEALPAGSDPSSVAFSPNSQILAVAEHDASAIAAYSVSAAAPLSLTSLPGSPLSTGTASDTVAFNRSGTLLAASDYTAGQIQLLTVDATSGLALDTTAGPLSTGEGSGPDDVAFSPTRDSLVAALGTANTAIAAAVPGTGPPTELAGSPLTTGTGPAAVAFNRQGTLVATANIYSNDVSVFTSTAPPPVVVAVRTRRVRLSGRTAVVRVACARVVLGGHGHPCAGTLTLSRAGHHLGQAHLRIQPGRAPRLHLRLPRSFIRLTAHNRRITITATLRVRGCTAIHRRLTVRR